MTTIERIRSGLRGESFRAALSGAFCDAYDQYVRLWLDQEGDPGHALEVIERGRSRALLDVLGGGSWLVEGKSGADADAALVARRNELCGLIAASHAMLDRPLGVAPRGKPVAAAELEVQLAEVERRLASTRRYAGEFSPPPSQQHLIAAIPAWGALIEYFVELDHVSAIVARDGTTTCHRGLCSLTQLSDGLGAIRLQLSIAMRSGMLDAAVAAPMAQEAMLHLGQLLVAPLWDRVGGASDIAIVADGQVAAVPFQSLCINAGWLVDLARIVRAPSAAIMNRLSTRLQPESARAPMVVIGLADANALRAEEESLEIARITGAQRVLLGGEATRQSVLRALDGAGSVHIASHARFVAHSPMQSAIRLADGWLTARDLYCVELLGGCVVLSACDTGRTGVGHGRELLGLGRAFLTAGAGSLILSQWLLHDAAAARMVSELYNVRKLSEGPPLSGSDALRLAQRSLRRAMPHPAAWGGWYCVGPWNQTGSLRS
ncbi:MAG: CHAT domain-containing protein [Planctomycetota bacterium]|nr:CHAT domain-containing protein [Planctomycetota bacterium]